jgi:hypothetical protein
MTATFPQERVTVSRLHRPALEALLRSLPAILAGSRPDYKGIRAGFHARIGFSVLSLIALDFETLGRGGVGAGGYTWARNTPEYLAYGKGPASSRSGTGQSPNNFLNVLPMPGETSRGITATGKLGRGPGTGFMDKSQLRRWWDVYLDERNRLLRHGITQSTAQRVGAQVAWADAKKRGVKTKIEEFGHKRVDEDQVLVDKGNLRRSLQPGTQSEGSGPEATYTPKNGDQIYQSDTTQLVVGSRVTYAQYHHASKEKGRRKKRRLWPETFPDAWWSEILGAGVRGLIRIKELAARGEL